MTAVLLRRDCDTDMPMLTGRLCEGQWDGGLLQAQEIDHRRNPTCWPFSLDFQPPELGENKVLLLRPLQFSSVTQWCPTLCDPMNCSRLGLPVHHQLLESCPLSGWCHPSITSSVVPSPSAINLSQHQGIFKWDGSLHHVAKVLEFQLQHQSFQWTPDWFPLGWTGWISLQPKGLSESSPTPQFKNINSSALRFLYSPTLTSIHDHRINHSLD